VLLEVSQFSFYLATRNTPELVIELVPETSEKLHVLTDCLPENVSLNSVATKAQRHILPHTYKMHSFLILNCCRTAVCNNCRRK